MNSKFVISIYNQTNICGVRRGLSLLPHNKITPYIDCICGLEEAFQWTKKKYCKMFYNNLQSRFCLQFFELFLVVIILIHLFPLIKQIERPSNDFTYYNFSIYREVWLDVNLPPPTRSSMYFSIHREKPGVTSILIDFSLHIEKPSYFNDFNFYTHRDIWPNVILASAYQIVKVFLYSQREAQVLLQS